MLVVTAFQPGDPVPFIVLMEAGDATFDAFKPAHRVAPGMERNRFIDAFDS